MADGPIECYVPMDPRCLVCNSFELGLGMCAELAETQIDRNIGYLTGWGNPLCFFIPAIGLILRRTSWLWVGLGGMISFLISLIAQRSVIDLRPYGACMKSERSCGMPSGHCMTSYATVVCVLLFFVRDLYRNGYAYYLTARGTFCFVIATIFLIIQALMGYGRWVTKYHTYDQIVYASVAGIAIGLVWFALCVFVVGPYVGPLLAKYGARIGVQDDWNYYYVHGRPILPKVENDEQQQQDVEQATPVVVEAQVVEGQLIEEKQRVIVT